jgi:hypothetical protein
MTAQQGKGMPNALFPFFEPCRGFGHSPGVVTIRVNSMQWIEARNFDLNNTLNSGQLFRYIAFGDHYIIHAGNRLFKIWQKGVWRGFIARLEKTLLSGRPSNSIGG